MNTAKSVRLAVQKVISLPEPCYGSFGPRTWAQLKALGDAPEDSEWPPKQIPSFANSRGMKIISAAQRFVGLTEVRSNASWDDQDTPGKDAIAQEWLELLLATGWQKTWPYCIAGVEVWWREGYQDDPELAAKIAKLITPSVMESFDNFKAQGLIKTSGEPLPGAIFFKQHGSKFQGHAGVVEKVVGKQWLTIEANTSAQAGTVEQERNGDGIFEKRWTPDYTRRASGLWLRGYANPI